MHVKENIMSNQIKSKKRVIDHGEVNTNLKEINAMLDLVENETLRIESKFLEPACGDGNFLEEVLKRKMEIIKKRFIKSQQDYEKNLFIVTASIYGVEILEDNVLACQKRLLKIIIGEYTKIYKKTYKQKLIDTLDYILTKNIIHGDALTLKSSKKDLLGESIIFSDWTIIGNGLVKRKDYIYSDLIDRSTHREMPLFSDLSDDDEAFIPEPIANYKPINFLEIANAEQN